MMRLNPIKLLTRSQSQMLRPSSPNKDEEKNLISFITKKRDNLISAKESTITPTISRRKVKIILPKINNSMVNNQPILINKKETIDGILNKYKNSPNPENSKEINNNNNSNILDMLFKKNNLIKKNRIKLNKIVLKKHMSTIDEIKRRNREIRRRKEKQ